MTIREFFRGFFLHACGAALALFAVCIAFETLMPGSVAPFVDLPALGLVALLAAIGGLIGSPNTATRKTTWVSLIAAAIVISALLAVLFFAIMPGGRQETVFFIAALATGALLLYSCRIPYV